MKRYITNISQLVTPCGFSAVRGSDMGKVNVIKDCAVEIENGVITDILPSDEVAGAEHALNVGHRAVIPAFCDCHSHFLFAGRRREELFLRKNGATYGEILKSGGGILSTARATRNASREELLRRGIVHLNLALRQGVILTEGKSGYGLDFETEIRQLEILRELSMLHRVEVVPTYLGAHALPPEFSADGDGYIDYIIDSVLGEVHKRNLAEFTDVFCEEGVFSYEQSKRLLLAAKKMGFALKIHADELKSSKGASLAAALEAVSADHLLSVDKEGIISLAAAGTVAVLLPCTAFIMGLDYAPARELINSGCAVALGSDFNPGSCHCLDIPWLIALAFFEMGMTAEEILTALTLNGAAALGRAAVTGSIEPQKQADMLILNTDDYRDMIYHTGKNLVGTVIKRGAVVYSAPDEEEE